MTESELLILNVIDNSNKKELLSHILKNISQSISIHWAFKIDRWLLDHTSRQGWWCWRLDEDSANNDHAQKLNHKFEKK